MFSEELEKYSWEETTREIYSKTAADVELALSKSQLAIDDFMALISPAAEKYLEPMAALSQKYTLQRFGKTISMYIPLYITNSCTNFCVYCGFNHNNPLKRSDIRCDTLQQHHSQNTSVLYLARPKASKVED